MTDAELLLSDEFVTFSQAVTSVHEEKKILEEEFKKYFEEYKNRKKELETKVANSNLKWEEWKKTQISSAKSKKE